MKDFATGQAFGNYNGDYAEFPSKYPPTEPEALRLRAPQRGLLATAFSLTSTSTSTSTCTSTITVFADVDVVVLVHVDVDGLY